MRSHGPWALVAALLLAAAVAGGSPSGRSAVAAPEQALVPSELIGAAVPTAQARRLGVQTPPPATPTPTPPSTTTPPGTVQHKDLPTPPAGKIPFPVDGGPSCFVFWNSFGAPRGTRRHEGSDIMGVAHQPVYAVVAGTLTARYTNTGTAGWGWTLVDAQTGIIYKYFHLTEDPAGRALGDRVEVGDVLGYVGDSGTTPGNFHLHFEVRPNNVAVQPLNVLDLRNCKAS